MWTAAVVAACLCRPGVSRRVHGSPAYIPASGHCDYGDFHDPAVCTDVPSADIEEVASTDDFSFLTVMDAVKKRGSSRGDVTVAAEQGHQLPREESRADHAVVEISAAAEVNIAHTVVNFSFAEAARNARRNIASSHASSAQLWAANVTSSRRGATRWAAQLQTSAYARASAIRTRFDGMDANMVVACVVIMVIVFTVIVLFGTIYFPGEDGKGSRGLKWRRASSNGFERSWEQGPPVLSPAGVLSARNGELLPLLVPERFISERHSSSSWSANILAADFNPLFVAQMRKGTQGQPNTLQILAADRRRADHATGGDLLGSTDTNLDIRDARRNLVGRLVANSAGEYLLKEATDTAEDRSSSMILVVPTDQSMLTYEVILRQTGLKLATVVRGTGSFAGYLKIMTGTGVDAVLILACVLGLTSFRRSEPSGFYRRVC